MYKTPPRAETINRFKILFSALVLGFLIWKLFARFEGVRTYDLANISVSSTFLLTMLSLTFVNLSFETLKWKSLVGELNLQYGFGAVLSGMKAGFITPNRIGEFAGRNAVLPKSLRVRAGLMTIVGSFIQGTVTFVFGIVGILAFPNWINLETFQVNTVQLMVGASLIGLCLIIGLKFKDRFARHFVELKGHLESISRVQALKSSAFAVLRYAVFSFQFYYCLSICGFNGGYFMGISGIAVVYLIQSFLPFSGFGELGIRELLSILVFGAFMPEPWMAAVATLMLWCFNICLPVFIGLALSKSLSRNRNHG